MVILGDKEALATWSLFKDLSWSEFEKIYGRLSVKFDVISGESKFSAGMVQEIEKMKEKGLLKDDKGAQVIDLKVTSQFSWVGKLRKK